MTTPKNDLARRAAILTALTLAGIASMATSPPDNSLPTVSVTLESPIPSFELSEAKPEAIIDIQVADSSTTAVSGRFVADLSLESEGAVEVIATFDPGGSRSGDFSSRTVDGAGELQVNGFLTSRGTIRVRMIGAGRVQGSGRAELRTNVPETADTSPSAFRFDLALQ